MKKFLKFIPLSLLVVMLMLILGICLFQAYNLFWKAGSNAKIILDSTNQVKSTKILTMESIPNGHKLWEQKYKISYTPSTMYINNTIEENFKVLYNDPNNQSANYSLAYCYFITDDNSKALKFVNKILNNDPNNVNALIAKAYFYYYKKDYNKSSEIVKCLERLEKNNPNILIYKAYISEDSGKKTDAISYYEEVLKVDPANIVARKAILKHKSNMISY